MKTLYEILGVKNTASAADIKKAYRSKAAKLHPDREGGDKEAFQQLQDAYDILSDPDKRAAYDRGEPINGRTPTEAERVEGMAMQKILECIDSALYVEHETDFKAEILKGCKDAERSAKAVHKEIRKRLRAVRKMKKRIKKAEFYIFDHLENRRRNLLIDFLRLRFDRKVIYKVREIIIAMEYIAPEPEEKKSGLKKAALDEMLSRMRAL